ncbi:zinc finger protein ZAT2-like [Musa acuminata AAA Group]|uniref:zinc finger protein ZAT2-like n=1 Tax=Musa acuminata AAA Group TaxID=214697 RepID=UPI0031E35ED9
MRSHPARKWRGAVPPSMRPGFEQEAANSLLLLSGAGIAQQRKYVCNGCKQEFDTGQALGGHRASHRNRKGCYARAKEVTRGGSKRKEQHPGRSGGETSRAKEQADEAEGEEGAAEAPTASGVAVEGTSRSSKRRRREHRVDLNLPPVSSSDTGSASSSSAGNSAP